MLKKNKLKQKTPKNEPKAKFKRGTFNTHT